jgi:hypothetical protein
MTATPNPIALHGRSAMKINSLPVLILCVLFGGCFHPRIIQERATIKGRAIEADTAKPIQGAKVDLCFQEEHFSAISNPKGGFLIPGLRYFDIGFVFDPPATHPTKELIYEIRIQKKGYQTWNRRFVYASSPSTLPLQDAALHKVEHSAAGEQAGACR